MSPEQHAAKLSIELPKYLQAVCKLNRLPNFTQHVLDEAKAYFQRNTTYTWWDVVAICALGIKLSRETPAPKYPYSRRHASDPRSLFERAKEKECRDDLILAIIQKEVRYTPGKDHSLQWYGKFITEELASAGHTVATEKVANASARDGTKPQAASEGEVTLDDAECLAIQWPKVMSRVMGQQVGFSERAKEQARSFFESHYGKDWMWESVIITCLDAYLITRERQGDTVFNCKRYATNPDKMFLPNKNGDYPIVRMGEELDALECPLPDLTQYAFIVNERLRRAGKKPLFKE